MRKRLPAFKLTEWNLLYRNKVQVCINLHRNEACLVLHGFYNNWNVLPEPPQNSKQIEITLYCTQLNIEFKNDIQSHYGCFYGPSNAKMHDLLNATVTVINNNAGFFFIFKMRQRRSRQTRSVNGDRISYTLLYALFTAIKKSLKTIMLT